MTIAAVWASYEQPGSATLWMASDSRLSDGSGPLIDEGIKLYELPVLCRRPGASGFFDTLFYETSFGMVCAGGSVVYQHVYATLIPLSANLNGFGTEVPAVGAVASLAAELTTLYVRSLGVRRRDAERVAMVIGGHSYGHAIPEAYALRSERDADGLVRFVGEAVPLSDLDVYFIGDRPEQAQELLGGFQRRNLPGAPAQRAALNVIRSLIDDTEAATIGGEVQIGHSLGTAFRRVATVVPDKGREPKALSLINGIDLETLSPVGPCGFGITGMTAP